MTNEMGVRFFFMSIVLSACGDNETIFVEEAAKAACSCYEEGPEQDDCVAELQERFQDTLDMTECRSMYRRDSDFSPEKTEDCLEELENGEECDAQTIDSVSLRRVCPNICKEL